MGKASEYGLGHPSFLDYTKFIVGHEVYEGMPDVYNGKGGIQWEAPSNRAGGVFKDTHQKRSNWWRKKAISVGIDPAKGDSWISRTAKKIHPTKLKPCKKCGREMTILYAYPSKILLKRITSLPYYDDSFSLDLLEDVRSLVIRMLEHYGDQTFKSLPNLLKVKGMTVPILPDDVDAWLNWIEEIYIPQEPSVLSPGAMSNAPDRFDGFHSFNRCCRESADLGRSKANLQSYATDRRVFEYWVDGDWLSANVLMGLIRSDKDLKLETCLNGHPGPCSADHIGPISLGFSHRPEFQMLCKSCNSAKNNRMYLEDVRHLIDVEAKGEAICSWYIKSLWDTCKGKVNSNETALRLSKLLRDNRHTYMSILNRISKEGHFTFLLSLQGLQYANYSPTFENLRVENHITRYDQINYKKRTTKYSIEQKARRTRVAFTALSDYQMKPTRNSFIISTVEIEEKLQRVLGVLQTVSKDIKDADTRLQSLLNTEVPSEELIRDCISIVPEDLEEISAIADAKSLLNEVMSLVSNQFSSMWTNERYVRTFDEDQDEL